MSFNNLKKGFILKEIISQCLEHQHQTLKFLLRTLFFWIQALQASSPLLDKTTRLPLTPSLQTPAAHSPLHWSWWNWLCHLLSGWTLDWELQSAWHTLSCPPPQIRYHSWNIQILNQNINIAHILAWISFWLNPSNHSSSWMNQDTVADF